MDSGPYLILLALVIGALCSGSEVALVHSNKLYVELQRQQGALWARLVARPLQRPARVISALLVGQAIALVVLGIHLAAQLGPWLRPLVPNEAGALLLSVPVSTLVALLVVEFLPTVLFRADPHFALQMLALPLRLLYALLWLPNLVYTAISTTVLGFFGIQGKPGQPVFRRVELDELLQQAKADDPQGDDLDAEVEYFRNTLELSNTKVRDVMVPRAEVEAISVDDTVAELHERFVSTGLSKLLVYKDVIDNIIGYVHGNELFRHPRTIRSVMRPVPFIPGTMPADQALQLFTAQRTHVAVVVDEFGGTAGMLTIEDVVETIVGDIEDEHDEGVSVEEQLGPGAFAFSARLEVADVNARFGLKLPESDEYDTLAGLILHRTGDVPQQGTVLEEGPYRITVAQVEAGRIDLVHLATLAR
ncbi:MAG TPA: hemolysin family protein [Flavobacteriales bacterium]